MTPNTPHAKTAQQYTLTDKQLSLWFDNQGIITDIKLIPELLTQTPKHIEQLILHLSQ